MRFCIYEEDSFKIELDHYVMAKLVFLKSSWYVFHSPYWTWNIKKTFLDWWWHGGWSSAF